MTMIGSGEVVRVAMACMEMDAVVRVHSRHGERVSI